MCGQATKAITTTSRRMRIRTGGGQVARTVVAAVAEVSKGQHRNHDFSLKAVAKFRMRPPEALESLATYIACKVAPANA